MAGHSRKSQISPPIVPPTQNSGQEEQLVEVYDVEAHHKVYLNQQIGFWDKYNKQADAYDKDLIKALALDLDTLLIFAGLFSAINTAFIIEAYKDLKTDQSEVTNNLVRTPDSMDT